MNIIKTLTKEVEKGNLCFDKEGNTVSLDKIEQVAKKSFLEDLKKERISFDASFEGYKNCIMEENYIPVVAVMNIIRDVIDNSFNCEDSYKSCEPCCPSEEVLA